MRCVAPLNAIVGFSELLASSEYSEEEKIRFAGEVNHSSELLLNLVNDVLDLSRLESGKIKFSVKPNDRGLSSLPGGRWIRFAIG